MIGYSLSHWGIVLVPDDENRQNVQFNQNDTIEALEPGEPLVIQCRPLYVSRDRSIASAISLRI